MQEQPLDEQRLVGVELGDGLTRRPARVQRLGRGARRHYEQVAIEVETIGLGTDQRVAIDGLERDDCLLYTSPSPRD